MSIKFTNKQIEILTVIRNGNTDGTPCSVYDILEKISYDCKRDALLHSIKILVEAEYVERRGLVKRGKRAMQVFGVTTKAAEII